MEWADGQTAPGHWYRIDLAAPAPEFPCARQRRGVAVVVFPLPSTAQNAA